MALNNLQGLICYKTKATNHCCIHIYTGYIQTHDKRQTHEERTQEGRHKKTSFELYSPLTLLQGFERVVEGLHVRGCLRPNINFIFWPHCYDRHVVSFLFSWCWGLLHRGFPRAPSVGCGLPYHIWSLMSGTLLATASGVSEVPLGRVWPSLPHLVSNPLGVCWQLLWDPNSTELNNNSTPTRSPTGSLNRMFNRHQAEITVMQFRGYSLPVHDCSGTMRPSPCPIS